jgi:hypothetical protein
MKRLWHLRSLILVVAFASGSFAAYAQETFYERFRAHNQDVTALQPYFITPLVEADPRLVQVVRATFSNCMTLCSTLDSEQAAEETSQCLHTMQSV